MKVLAPLVMGYLGKEKSQGGLDVSGLAQLLSGGTGGMSLPGWAWRHPRKDPGQEVMLASAVCTGPACPQRPGAPRTAPAGPLSCR